ncbi:Glycosyl transferase, group 1 [Minicystis rosea]|nr:Glycosyl transferase, group 1 [Minicystis rosea]
MTTRILHVAPFDPSRFPPLINTVHVCAAAGIESTIIASLPVQSPSLFGNARIIAPTVRMGGGKQVIYLLEQLRAIEDALHLVIGHNTRGIATAAATRPLRTPIVYHCHDFDGAGEINVRDTILRGSEYLAARRATEIWVPAAERIDIATARGLHRPTVLVRNCPRRIPELPAKGRLRAWLAREGARGGGQGRIITRHGLIGDVHYIRETIEAMPLLPEDVLFVIIGDGDQDAIARYRATAARLGLADRVFFHPFIPHSELGALLIDGDVGMCIYAPTDLNAMTPAPNKVFENLALGIPVVVSEGNSVADDVVGAEAGLAVPIGSREALANALGRLVEQSPFAEAARRAAREAHLAEYNYETQLHGTRLGALLAGARA